MMSVLALQLLAEQSMTPHVLLLFVSHQLLLLRFQTDAAGPSVFQASAAFLHRIGNSIQFSKLKNHLKHNFSLI